MFLGWIAIGVIVLIIGFALEVALGLPFEAFIFFFLVILLAIALFVTLYPLRYEEKENKKLKEKMPNGCEYYIGGSMYNKKGALKRVVLNSEKLYIRMPFYITHFYDCKKMKSVKISYQVNDELVDEDPYGAAKMGAVSGVASWFGIGTIVDFNSFSNEVWKKRFAMYIVIEMNDKTLKLCAANEIVEDDALLDRVKETLKFVENLKSIINNKAV